MNVGVIVSRKKAANRCKMAHTISVSLLLANEWIANWSVWNISVQSDCKFYYWAAYTVYGPD